MPTHYYTANRISVSGLPLLLKALQPYALIQLEYRLLYKAAKQYLNQCILLLNSCLVIYSVLYALQQRWPTLVLNNLPGVSQLTPVNPSGQKHLYPVDTVKHCPPFRHGDESHSLMTGIGQVRLEKEIVYPYHDNIEHS